MRSLQKRWWRLKMIEKVVDFVVEFSLLVGLEL